MLSHHGACTPELASQNAHEKQSSQRRDHRSLYFRASTPARSALLWLAVLSIVASLFTAADAHGHLREDSLDTPSPPPVPLLMPPVRDGDPSKTTTAPPSKRSDAGFSVPKPFDSSLSNNFTDNCANFFSRMLTGDTINTCHPFSMLLQTSTGLFDASKSFVRITQTLEATCAANMTQCLGGMNALARELKTNAACGVDYNNNNAQAVQAYNALIAYEPLYRASCLRDDDGNFCYANAVTNTTTQGTDANPYYMPLGMKLVSGRPTCNTCLQNTMAIFSTFAGNASQPLSQTYPAGAQQVIVYCGQNFVNVTAAPLKAAASTTIAFTPTITLFIMVFFYLFG
ncbi:hypothetical protein P280DRAFT_467440 [Massarina eburnea CBS 473.64]|uniref:DUF7729 domain-containing protein n=1 Tax=Massarina eburnea CBS 473.64 TaxID=1395130 RepID=A0A6A6SAG3_9PLEO|nr:hypothetical protein P280DRAFT_467440 [Massarina eburnea CBS 473.64]